jgi:uncharacterized phage protein gp47/JayE
MQLQLQTFTTLVANAAAAVQGAASQLVDLTVGSVLRAVLEANAAMALWLQWLILQVLRVTRAATSEAGDLDSWMADYSFDRLAGVPAHGSLTFGRFTPTTQALIPVGASVRTADGTRSFAVTADPSNPAWSSAQNGYVVPAGTAAVTVAAAALASGSAGNVQPGAVSLLASAISGIDTVTNAFVFQGGYDAESDVAFRARFQLYLVGLARATRTAVAAAIQGVQQGILYNIAENQKPDGTAEMGFFTITVDDGTGYPPAALLAAVSTDVDPVRPLGSQFVVQAPTVWTVDIALTITVGFGAVAASTNANVTAVLTSFLDSFSLGAPLTWSRILQVVYSADATVINATNLLVNGGTADIIPPGNVVLKAGAVTVGN